MKRLLKAVGQVRYELVGFITEHGDQVNVHDYHQLCRYNIHVLHNNDSVIVKFDATLQQIADWLAEVI